MKLGQTMRSRSTYLKLAERHCGYAVFLLRQGVEADWSQTQRGTAAHAMLQAAGEAANHHDRALTPAERHRMGRELVARLTTKGRKFDGVPEAPLYLPAVREGVALALDWLDLFGEPEGEFELPLGMTPDGKPSAYKAGWYVGILDHVREEETELARTLVHRDYKTFWSASEQLLHSTQVRGQAVLLHANGRTEGFDEIRMEIANMRTKQVFSETVTLGDGGDQWMLDEWRQDIVAQSRALEGVQEPSPGPRCMDCPFLAACPGGADYLGRKGLGDSTEERVRELGVLEARRKQLRAALKEELGGRSIVVDGMECGFVAKEIRAPRDDLDAINELLSAWTGAGGNVEGLLYAAGLGVGQLENIGKVLYAKDKEGREDLMSRLVRPAQKIQFGFARKGEK